MGNFKDNEEFSVSTTRSLKANERKLRVARSVLVKDELQVRVMDTVASDLAELCGKEAMAIVSVMKEAILWVGGSFLFGFDAVN